MRLMQSSTIKSHCSYRSLVVMNPTFKTCFQDAGPKVKLFKLLFNWSLIIPISRAPSSPQHHRQSVLREDAWSGLHLCCFPRIANRISVWLLFLKNISEKGDIFEMRTPVSGHWFKMVMTLTIQSVLFYNSCLFSLPGPVRKGKVVFLIAVTAQPRAQPKTTF